MVKANHRQKFSSNKKKITPSFNQLLWLIFFSFLATISIEKEIGQETSYNGDDLNDNRYLGYPSEKHVIPLNSSILG